LARLVEATHFNLKESQRLAQRFQELRDAETGKVTVDAFCGQIEVAMSPILAMYVQRAFKESKDMDLEDFVETLSMFSPRASRKEKIRVLLTAMGVKPLQTSISVKQYADFLLTLRQGNLDHESAMALASGVFMEIVGPHEAPHLASPQGTLEPSFRVGLAVFSFKVSSIDYDTLLTVHY